MMDSLNSCVENQQNIVANKIMFFKKFHEKQLSEYVFLTFQEGPHKSKAPRTELPTTS